MTINVGGMKITIRKHEKRTFKTNELKKNSLLRMHCMKFKLTNSFGKLNFSVVHVITVYKLKIIVTCK